MTRDDLILQEILPVTHDLGGFKVHRTLPSRPRTMVGPFLFFDQMGPAEMAAGQGIDVRPHPHINWPPSPISFRVRSGTAIRWAPTSSSNRVR